MDFEDREAQVRLYELLAENKLNSGHVEEAKRLRQRSEDLRGEGPSNDQLWFRVLLRTGRLEEARRGLEELAETESQVPVQTPRAHRETKLLLSLIYSFMGMSHHAYQAALDGTRRGDTLKSPFVTAVGHMRQGHALNLNPSINEDQGAPALSEFEKTIELSQTLDVPLFQWKRIGACAAPMAIMAICNVLNSMLIWPSALLPKQAMSGSHL